MASMTAAGKESESEGVAGVSRLPWLSWPGREGGARGGSQSLLVGKNTRGWCGAETEDREATFPDVGGNSFEGFLK